MIVVDKMRLKNLFEVETKGKNVRLEGFFLVTCFFSFATAFGSVLQCNFLKENEKMENNEREINHDDKNRTNREWIFCVHLFGCLLDNIYPPYSMGTKQNKLNEIKVGQIDK